MTLSIIIPVYHVEPYVRRCLESVMSQGQAGAGVECIIVDDCGQDRSMEIVRKTIADYQGNIRFVIIEHEKNRGLSAARNTGLRKASGDYVMFMDSDDYLMPDSIPYFVENQRRYPEADVLVGNVMICKSGKPFFRAMEEPQLLNEPAVFFRQMLQRQIYLYAWNKVVRRSVLVEHDITFVEGILYEDEPWSYQLFNSVNSVLLLPKVTYAYEYNGQSIVQTSLAPGKADKVVWSFLASCNTILDTPPDPSKFGRRMEVDYLIFACNILMRVADYVYCHHATEHMQHFRTTRQRLMSLSRSQGHLVLSAFFLLLYPPLCYLNNYRWFRRIYYDQERMACKVCHLTDSLHG